MYALYYEIQIMVFVSACQQQQVVRALQGEGDK